MPAIRILLLGPPQLEADGAPVHVDTKKAIGLLAHLALEGGPHSRDAIAGLLWPDYGQGNARGALRRTLSTLNKALGAGRLISDREMVRLQSDEDVFVDAVRFRALLAQSRMHTHGSRSSCPACVDLLTEAVDLYRGDFLSGFSLRDTPEFDDWQFFQAESFRQELAEALDRLAGAHEVGGRLEDAIACARRRLSLDPLHEPAHQRLMVLYSRAGQRAAALRQYRECVRVLEEELAVPPLAETTHLYQTIKENRDVSAVMAPAQVIPEVDSRLPGLPLVGRGVELRQVLDIYEAAVRDPRVVLIEGEAGIGKTRFAEEIADQARELGGRVLRVRCYEGEAHLAYAPIITLLRDALASLEGGGRMDERARAQDLAEAARLVPGPGEPSSLPPLEGSAAHIRFMEGVVHVLLTACDGEPPGLLFVDDVHWADASTLDLLAYLVRRLEHRRLCVVLTWRSEDVPVDHRLRRLAAEARRSGRATLLTLRRLDRSSVDELVRSVVPAAADRSGRLFAETEGLPLFLAEYLAAMRDRELAPGGDVPALPGGVRDLLVARLTGVSDTGRQILSTAAAIGRSFDFETVRDASGRDEEMVIAALEELLGRGLIEELSGDAGPMYDFSHAKLRDLVYEETSLVRRRVLHRRIAETLTAAESRGMATNPGRIARHFQLAGQDGDAAEYYKQAGDRARSLYANREALEHYRAALALGYGAPAALHEGIGDMQTLLGEYEAAIESYETAAALSGGTALGRNEHKLGEVYGRQGEWDLSESYYASALAALDERGPADERARILADWSRTAYRRGDVERAVDLAQQALKVAEAGGGEVALAQAHNMLGILTNAQGDTAAARAHLEASIALSESRQDQAAQAAALNNLALISAAAGEIDQAQHLTERALELSASQGDRHREAALHNNLADLLHATGDAQAAMAHLEQAVTILAEIGAEAGTLQPEIWKLTEW